MATRKNKSELRDGTSTAYTLWAGEPGKSNRLATYRVTRLTDYQGVVKGVEIVRLSNNGVLRRVFVNKTGLDQARKQFAQLITENPGRVTKG